MTNPFTGSDVELKKSHIGIGGLSAGALIAVLGLLTQINGLIDDRIKQNADLIQQVARQEILASPVIKARVQEAVEAERKVFASEAGGIKDQLLEMKTLMESMRRDVGELKISFARIEGPQRGR